VGHIGYVVLPEFRRQRCYYDPPLAIQIAREKLGIGRILVTCDDDHMGSIRTIKKTVGSLRTSSTSVTATNKSAATGLKRSNIGECRALFVSVSLIACCLLSVIDDS
jgi:predicted acetyltransferase